MLENISKIAPKFKVDQQNINKTERQFKYNEDTSYKVEVLHTFKLPITIVIICLSIGILAFFVKSLFFNGQTQTIPTAQVQGIAEEKVSKPFKSLNQKLSKLTIEEYFNRTKSEYIESKTPEFKLSSVGLFERCKEINTSDCIYDKGDYGNFKSIFVTDIFPDGRSAQNVQAYNKSDSIGIYFNGEVERNDKDSSKFGITGYFNFVVQDKINEETLTKMESNKNTIQEFIKIQNFSFSTSCVDKTRPTINCKL